MSTAMRVYLVVVTAGVLIPWALTELTLALGWGVRRDR